MNSNHTINVDLDKGCNISAFRLRNDHHARYGWKGVLRDHRGMMLANFDHYPTGESVVKAARKHVAQNVKEQ